MFTTAPPPPSLSDFVIVPDQYTQWALRRKTSLSPCEKMTEFACGCFKRIFRSQQNEQASHRNDLQNNEILWNRHPTHNPEHDSSHRLVSGSRPRPIIRCDSEEKHLVGLSSPSAYAARNGGKKNHWKILKQHVVTVYRGTGWVNGKYYFRMHAHRILELIDKQYHRYGRDLYYQWNIWKNLEPEFTLDGDLTPESRHFFTWLHQQEHLPEGQGRVEISTVTYFDRRKKAFRRLYVKDDKCYTLQNAKPLHTTESDEHPHAYVLLEEEGEVSLYVDRYVRGEIHHSSLAANGRVLAAGEIHFLNGRPEKITDESGHFRSPDITVDPKAQPDLYAGIERIHQVRADRAMSRVVKHLWNLNLKSVIHAVVKIDCANEPFYKMRAYMAWQLLPNYQPPGNNPLPPLQNLKLS